MRLGEINIICTSIERSRAFYCGLLGFEALEFEGTEALHLKLGEQKFLLLAVAKEQRHDEKYCTRAAIGFDLNVPDLLSLVEKLKAAGVAFERELKDGYCFVRDPDGLVIEMLGF